MTLQWGRAKTNFIRAQMAQGRTLEMAKMNWVRARADLKARHIHYPPASLHRGEMDVQETFVPTGTKRHMTDLDAIDPQQPGGSGTKRKIKPVDEAQLRQSAEGEDLLLQGEFEELSDSQIAQLLSEEIHEDPLTQPLRPLTPEPTQTSQPVNRANTLQEMTQPTIPEMMDQTRGTRKRPAEENVQDLADAAGDGPDAGQLDNIGRGGGGGGLAGAGNNQYFHGFAKSSKPRDPPDYEYVDTYRRPWQVHTQFPDIPATGYASTISKALVPWTDTDTAGPLGYQTGIHWAEITRPSIMIPYWFMEASMKSHDWNKPADHVAYQVLEYGFDCPNMRLNILNNPKDTPEDVAPAPPADARMWTFTDIYNDYGIPEAHAAAACTHSNAFTTEDIIDTAYASYALPICPPRHIPLTPPYAQGILAERNWQDDGTSYWTNDVNAIYDFKRHPGYHEMILSEASFGLSYKPNSPAVRFPHSEIQSLDGHTRVNNGYQVTDTNAIAVTPWSNYQKQQMLQDQLDLNNSQNAGQRYAAAQKTSEVEYYIANQSALFNDMRDNETASASYSAGIDQFTDKTVRPPGNAAIIGQAPLAKLRTKGREDVSDDGSVHAKHISKRPPMFMIGLFKELEYRSEPKFWRYYLYGQVNYWVKIKWFVQPNRTECYIPIGLGGVYTKPSDGISIQSRKWPILDKIKYRYTRKPLLNTTAYEIDYLSDNYGTYMVV